MKVRLFKPSVGEEEIKNIKEIFDISWLGLGGKVVEFENKWSEYIQCEESIAVNSATAALHLALSAFNFPKGKKVLVPALTFASTATAIHYNHLEPVFVDCDMKTLGISLEDLEKKIDRDCVAVMIVHFGGHANPMDEIKEIARVHNLKIIEDCAHTQGGEYKGKKLGTLGDIGCFSFEEKKGMTTGDGGMICSLDKDLISHLRAKRWVGIDKDTWKRKKGNSSNARHWYYDIDMLGYKYNMNNLAAAIGIAQLQKLSWINQSKLNAIKRYLNGIHTSDDVEPLLPYDLSGKSCYWLFGLRLEKRDILIEYLAESDIATGVHYTPLTMQKFWQNYQTSLPNVEYLYNRMVTLPLFPDISDSELNYVIEKINSFIEKEYS